jgi:DNA-directed RNA polymerase II subunit RPB1
MDASIYGETDYMRAVSENVLMGQLAPIGTGVFDLYMDDRKTVDDNLNIQSCALDFATPVLRNMKGRELSFVNSPDAPATELPAMTPYDMDNEEQLQASEGPMSDLQTPFITPEYADSPNDDLITARSPFSPMGVGTPFSHPSTGVRQSPMSDKSSPATPDETSQFRSPSYTPASESPDNNSPAYSEFSQSYPYSASPAYTPDGSVYQSSRAVHTTSSPSFVAQAAYTPTYSPSHTPFGAHYGSPGTSAYSPPTASPHGYGDSTRLEPTSPVDTPMAYSPASPGVGEFMSPAPIPSPGQPTIASRFPRNLASGSPIVQEFPAEAPDSPDYVAPTSPSYTPHAPGRAGRPSAPMAVPGTATELASVAEDSDDDAMSAIFEPTDEQLQGTEHTEL